MSSCAPSSRIDLRRAWWAAALLLAFLAGAPLATRGQDAAKDAGAAPPAAAAAPAAPPAAPAAGEVSRPRASMLSYLLKAHGDPLAAAIGLTLLGISIWFVAQVIRFFLEFRVEEAVPPALVEKLDGLINERKFQEAYDACREDDSFLARLVRAGIANLPGGREESKQAMNLVSEETVVTMESRISYLATIGTLGPMIGLVGTIWGMINSFQEIAMASGQQPAADKVAGGIATALFITLEGISLSVPAIFFFAFFRNRIASIAMEATKVADAMINKILRAAQQPQAGQPARA